MCSRACVAHSVLLVEFWGLAWGTGGAPPASPPLVGLDVMDDVAVGAVL